MAENQKDLLSERKAHEPVSQCFPTPHSAHRVQRHQHSCDVSPLAPLTPPGSSHALRAGRGWSFRRAISWRLWALHNAWLLTTMSLHTMSVICSRIEDNAGVLSIGASKTLNVLTDCRPSHD